MLPMASGTPQNFMTTHHTTTPQSTASSDHTFLMSASPRRRGSMDNYRPKILSTVGQRPACLVSASVTFVGDNELYAFGGFDQYTDEVYNHVLRLNLETRQWSLIDNYGDIPSVRMGHTATLWQNGKLLVFGGENEHRMYLSDVIIFDIKTAHWHAPDIRGQPPRGRARHAAVIHDDKLFIVGGLSGFEDSTILDDICYLDLKTWTWSRTWRFVPRFDHTCWVWGSRLWVFGGITEGMERVNGLWWYDFKQDPTIRNLPAENVARTSIPPRQARPQYPYLTPPSSGASTHTANSAGLVQASQASIGSRRLPMAPGSVSSVDFVSGTNIPLQNQGTHFHALSSGCLLDFVTPSATPSETSLCALDLDAMRWEKLIDGREIFNSAYRWHYCALNEEGTFAWLLGCPIRGGTNNGANEYLSDVLPIDLRKLGLLGNNLDTAVRLEQSRLPASDSHIEAPFSGLGADLAKFFDKAPETGSGTDFVVVADSEDIDEGDSIADENVSVKASAPIHVHSFILQARWPHFARMIAAQMAEFHSKRLHVPEPYSAVRAFLFYLYADTIMYGPDSGTNLNDVAGMLVMANLYDMPRLRTLCRNLLGRELDVEHAALIWDRAGVANEEWLKRRAARFCMTHWGRVVRTAGFLNLRRASLMELCQEVDTEGRVLGAEELEVVGGLGGATLSGGVSIIEPIRQRKPSVIHDEAESSDDDQGMELT